MHRATCSRRVENTVVEEGCEGSSVPDLSLGLIRKPLSMEFPVPSAPDREADQNETALINAGTEVELALMKSERTLTALVEALHTLEAGLRNAYGNPYTADRLEIADQLSDVLRTYGVRVG